MTPEKISAIVNHPDRNFIYQQMLDNPKDVALWDAAFTRAQIFDNFLYHFVRFVKIAPDLEALWEYVITRRKIGWSIVLLNIEDNVYVRAEPGPFANVLNRMLDKLEKELSGSHKQDWTRRWMRVGLLVPDVRYYATSIQDIAKYFKNGPSANSL